ncbi:MAG: hypothetical protein ACKVIR_06220, partial [Candidatus Poseidoniales archaeon]
MANRTLVPLFLSLLLVFSTFSMVNFEVNKLEEVIDEKNSLGQGKRSTNAIQFSEGNSNFTLNETNKWIWFEITSNSAQQWLNLSIEGYDDLAYGDQIYVRAYSHNSNCIDSQIAIYSWSSLNLICSINSADKTILVVIDLTNNGIGEWHNGNVSLDLSTSTYQNPTPVDPGDYQYADGDLNQDSTYYLMSDSIESASGYFDNSYDEDYFKTNLVHSGIYQVNVTYNENYSLYLYGSSAICSNGLIENTSNRYYSCFALSDNLVFTISNYSWSFIDAEPWTVNIQISQVRPIEDEIFGDSPSYNSNQKLLHGTESIDASYLDSFDTDWFSVNIEHGFDQRISISSENEAVIGFSEYFIAIEHCSLLQGESLEMATSVVIKANVETVILCDTNHFSDKIDFGISAADYNSELGYNYSIALSKVENNSGLDVNDSGNNYDAAPRGSNNNLVEGIHEGGFHYASDTIDQYSITTPPNSVSTINLESDCATIQGSSNNHGRITSKTYSNNGDEEISNDLIVQRTEELDSEIPMSIYPICEYRFNLTHANYSSNWAPPLSGYLSINTVVTMDDVQADIAQAENNESTMVKYGITNIELAPNKMATINATQASGKPLTLVAYGSDETRGENEIQIGGMIEVGKDYVYWQILYFYGLDGSATTVRMELSATQLLTDEVNEIKSLATGYLGVSNDEGYDSYDSWNINNSDDASMISIRLTDVDSGLEVSIDGGIGRTQCAHNVYNPLTGYYENGFDPVRVNLDKGSGKYSLRVDKIYGECFSSSTNSPSIIPAGKTIKINGYIQNNIENRGQVNYQLVSNDLQIIASTDVGDISDWSLMSIPHDAFGYYHLQTIHWTGFLLESSKVLVTNSSFTSTIEVRDILDLNENPSISIDSWLPYNMIPTEWSLENIEFHQDSINGSKFIQSFANISGNGLEIIEFELDSELEQGTWIVMEAILVSDETITPVYFNWITGSLNLQTECQSSIQPVIGDPESDLICTINGDYSNSDWPYNLSTNAVIPGILMIYRSDGSILESHDFEINNGIANIRIPTWNFLEEEYYAVATSIYGSSSTSMMDRIDNFFVDETLNPESEYSELGVFEFSAYSLKDNAMGGDEISIQWNSVGENISAIRWTLNSTNYQDGASFALDGGITEGTFKISLPSYLNPEQDYSIVVEAYSIYGQSVSETIYIYGAENGPEVFVDINPQRPSIGEEFTVEITAPNANKWLSYSWTLTHNSALLSFGDGWVDANQASFKATLPTMQFSSEVLLTVTSEDHSGLVFYNTVSINPFPMREIHVNTDEYAVSGESFDFAFSINGKHLNSIDSVKSATLTITSMNDIIIQEEVFIINSKNGEFSTMIP